MRYTSIKISIFCKGTLSLRYGYSIPIGNLAGFDGDESLLLLRLDIICGRDDCCPSENLPQTGCLRTINRRLEALRTKKPASQVIILRVAGLFYLFVIPKASRSPIVVALAGAHTRLSMISSPSCRPSFWRICVLRW